MVACRPNGPTVPAASGGPIGPLRAGAWGRCPQGVAPGWVNHRAVGAGRSRFANRRDSPSRLEAFSAYAMGRGSLRRVSRFRRVPLERVHTPALSIRFPFCAEHTTRECPQRSPSVYSPIYCHGPLPPSSSSLCTAWLMPHRRNLRSLATPRQPRRASGAALFITGSPTSSFNCASPVISGADSHTDAAMYGSRVRSQYCSAPFGKVSGCSLWQTSQRRTKLSGHSSFFSRQYGSMWQRVISLRLLPRFFSVL